MITIGIDPHNDTHTAAAVEDSSGQLTTPATDAGAEVLLAWAHRFAGDGELRFALEDVRNVSGCLERFLVARAELVLRVGTRLMVRNPQIGRHLRQVGLDRRRRDRPRRRARAGPALA